MPTQYVAIAVVVLTYNRLELLQALLRQLADLAWPGLEIIVVDNCSTIPASTLEATFPGVTFLRSPRNVGTGGRNIGIAAARADIVVCLDDDVSSLTSSALELLAELFVDPRLGAVCFKVIEADTGNVTNWVHHKPLEAFADREFETYEITEGAVAFRRTAAVDAGLYPEHFFISHEGPDLALRLIDRGFEVRYVPRIQVVHAYSPLARASWRNYYYDTRNTFWLAARNLPVRPALRMLAWQIGSMLLYSLRDGFFVWWLRGIRDGLAGLPQAFRERQPVSKSTLGRLAAMDKDRAGIAYLLRTRLFRRGIKI